MKAIETMIAYDPTKKLIKVGPWPDNTGWSRHLGWTAGACYSSWRENPKNNKVMLFIEAIHLIVRDKFDPQVVHNEFLKIDEYKDACADDMPGINGCRTCAKNAQDTPNKNDRHERS